MQKIYEIQEMDNNNIVINKEMPISPRIEHIFAHLILETNYRKIAQ